MTSSGGTASEGTALTFPVRLLLSGPAGGVVAGVHLGKVSGTNNLITYDMGGTSTDVCLIKDLSPELSIRRIVAAFPILTPMVDIHTIGAGGGSIAWVDRTGALRIGPQSAGANPGPACYGQGGTEFTITDANLLLGRISPSGLLGGTMPLRRDLAEEAALRIGQAVGIGDVHRLAEGVIRLAIANMAGAVRAVSIERGHDPRDFVLVAAGGAGPAHAIPIAEELGIPTVIVPRAPGNFCATGLLVSDLKQDYVKSHRLEFNKGDLSHAQTLLLEMEEEGRQVMRRDGVPRERISVQHVMSLRYLGQTWELDIPVNGKALDKPHIEKTFHDVHLREYGYNRPDHPIELVNLRVAVVGQVPKPRLTAGSGPVQTHSAAAARHRKVYFGGGFVDCPVYEREALSPTASLAGPAIIEEFGSFTIVFPNWKASTGELGNLVLEGIK